MPYASNADLPDYIKKYTEKIQSMWRYVFNSTWNKLEGVKERESRAFRAANSTIKRRMEEHGTNQYGHDTFFRMKIDNWLGNLRG